MAATITNISTRIPSPSGGLLELDCILAINITDGVCSAVIWNGTQWSTAAGSSNRIIQVIQNADNELVVRVNTTEGREWKVCCVPGPNH